MGFDLLLSNPSEQVRLHFTAAEPKYNPKCSEQGKGSPPFFLFALFSPASLSPLSPSRIVAVFSEQVYLQTGGQVFFLLLF